MNRDEAIAILVHRMARAAADHNNHLAHIHLAALHRLRDGDYPFDTATEQTEDDGNRMFGEAA